MIHEIYFQCIFESSLAIFESSLAILKTTRRALTKSEEKFALVSYPSDGCLSILGKRKLELEGESKDGIKERHSKFRVMFRGIQSFYVVVDV